MFYWKRLGREEEGEKNELAKKKFKNLKKCFDLIHELDV